MRERGAKTQAFGSPTSVAIRTPYVGYPKAKRAKKVQTVLNKINKIIKQIITFKNHSLPW
jgi:hypothetical protein